ncbi:MAG: hypothetical protein A4E63_01669 [Syntrophorhabdus sp. PtaU1.Bin050]|nr:MAG: hypothetical protein A4E63_01669 [Syntrophorhabdus sp. PtaU1.Bin050]
MEYGCDLACSRFQEFLITVVIVGRLIGNRYDTNRFSAVHNRDRQCPQYGDMSLGYGDRSVGDVASFFSEGLPPGSVSPFFTGENNLFFRKVAVLPYPAVQRRAHQGTILTNIPEYSGFAFHRLQNDIQHLSIQAFIGGGEKNIRYPIPDHKFSF